MKRSVFTKLLSCFLAILMIVPAAATVYAAEASGGKYVKDVFIAYGEDKAKAEEWLRQKDPEQRESDGGQEQDEKAVVRRGFRQG